MAYNRGDRANFISIFSRLDDPSPHNRWAPLERVHVLPLFPFDINVLALANPSDLPVKDRKSYYQAYLKGSLRPEYYDFFQFVSLLRADWNISRPTRDLAVVFDVPSNAVLESDLVDQAGETRSGTSSEFKNRARHSSSVVVTSESQYHNLLAHLNSTGFFDRASQTAQTTPLRVKLVPVASLDAHKSAIESTWGDASTAIPTAPVQSSSEVPLPSRVGAQESVHESVLEAEVNQPTPSHDSNRTDTFGSEVAGFVRSAVQEALGRSLQLPTTVPSTRTTSGTDAGQFIVNLLGGLLGSDPQSSGPPSNAAASDTTPGVEGRRSDDASGSRDAPSVASTHIPDPPEEQPSMLSDFERVMARSRAQGEALNQFFGTVTQRRAGRQSDAGDAELSGTDTPPANPLRETPIKGTLGRPSRVPQDSPLLTRAAPLFPGPRERTANEVTSTTAAASTDTASQQITAQNNLLESLWEQRLGEIGHGADSQHGPRIARPVAPPAQGNAVGDAQTAPSGTSGQRSSSSPLDSPWTMLKSETTSEAGSLVDGESHRDGSPPGTAGPSNAEASTPATQELVTPVSRPTVEDSNDALADAFAEMLARARGGA